MKIKIWLFFLASLLALGCGRKGGGSGGGSDDSTPQVVDDADASPLPGPRGPQGEDGAPGTPGDPGSDGRPGASIVLYDVNDNLIGYKFDANGDIADVFLPDGKRAHIDMLTGELDAPLFNFFCLYESTDCSGACYVYDKRWLNVVVLSGENSTMVAVRGSANQGSKNFKSYVHDQNGCTVNDTVTMESYQAKAYVPSVSLPAAAPLYWGVDP